MYQPLSRHSSQDVAKFRLEPEYQCKCKHRKTENLGGAMEHRCCIEFLNIKRKLVFDGSIENLDSLIQHEQGGAWSIGTVDRTDADLESHTTSR